MLRNFKPLFFVLFISACSSSVDTSIKNSGETDEVFSSLLQEAIDHSFGSVPGVSMTINSSLLEASWSGAAGFADKELNRPLKVDQCFRVASLTKTFVAAAILRLHEMDSLSIYDPINNFLDQETISILKSDNYNPEEILIKHCLNHTSGLFDYAMGGSSYINEVIKNPKKKWTRKEQLEAAMKWGNKLGEPGQQTGYSDTGYIILGSIIERYFNGSLADGLRSLLKFKELGLNATWLENLESHSLEQESVVDRYFSRYETTEWDASIDLYGGGGLVSNTKDLSNFFYSLFQHKIFDDKKTLDLMLTRPDYIHDTKVNDKQEIEFYNYGMWTIQIFGHDAYLHNGLWGTTMLFIPEYQSSIAINATKGEVDRVIKKVILVLKELKEDQ